MHWFWRVAIAVVLTCIFWRAFGLLLTIVAILTYGPLKRFLRWQAIDSSTRASLIGFVACFLLGLFYVGIIQGHYGARGFSLRVQEGMSAEDVRLKCGTPDEINQGEFSEGAWAFFNLARWNPTLNDDDEVWEYHCGVVVRFFVIFDSSGKVKDAHIGST
jgi:hypothetical protein